MNTLLLKRVLERKAEQLFNINRCNLYKTSSETMLKHSPVPLINVFVELENWKLLSTRVFRINNGGSLQRAYKN